jgi:hypothetical protein
VSVGQADVGVGAAGVSVDGPGDTAGVGVGHGCAAKEAGGNVAITSKTTAGKIERPSNRIASLLLLQISIARPPAATKRAIRRTAHPVA